MGYREQFRIHRWAGFYTQLSICGLDLTSTIRNQKAFNAGVRHGGRGA